MFFAQRMHFLKDLLQMTAIALVLVINPYLIKGCIIFETTCTFILSTTFTHIFIKDGEPETQLVSLYRSHNSWLAYDSLIRLSESSTKNKYERLEK